MSKLRIPFAVVVFLGLVGASVHLSSATSPNVTLDESNTAVVNSDRSQSELGSEPDVLKDWDFTSRSRGDDDRCRFN